MPTIQVLWHLGKAHHTIDTPDRDSWWWAYSEADGAPSKYFNVIFKSGFVEQVNNTADLTEPPILKEYLAPLPKKKLENKP